MFNKDTSHKTLFGPLPLFFVKKLEATLQSHEAYSKIFVSHDELQAYIDDKRMHHTYTKDPWRGPASFAYIEVALKDILLIRGELENMGIPVRSGEISAELQVPEYICPKCDDVFSIPGLCPKHQIPMLEFSDWVEAKKKLSAVRWSYFSRLALILIIGMIICIGIIRRSKGL